MRFQQRECLAPLLLKIVLAGLIGSRQDGPMIKGLHDRVLAIDVRNLV